MTDNGSYHLMAGNLFGLFLLGTYTRVGIGAAKVLYQRYQTNGVNYYQLATFVAITLTCFSRVILDSVRTINAFTNPGPGGLITYPSYNAPGTLATTCLWVVETAIADAFIAYRVWIVWQKKWWILIVPILLLLGSVGGGFFLLYSVMTLGANTPEAAFERGNIATLLFTYFTLFLSIVCTALIASRIWFVRRRVSKSRVSTGSDPIRKTLALIFESAAIYTILLLAVIITVSIRSLLSFALFQIVPPTIAIVFSSIIVRSAQGRAEGDGTHSQHVPTGGQSHRTVVGGGGGGVESMSRQPTFMQRGMQIKLERVVTQRVDGESQIHYVEDSEDTDRDVNSEKDIDDKIVR